MNSQANPTSDSTEKSMPRRFTVRAEKVSKKFGTTLKDSMRFGLLDSVRSLVGFPASSSILRPGEIVRRGYVVWAPSHLLYTQLESLYEKNEHHFVLTQFICQSLDAISEILPEHKGFVVAGSAAGGITGPFLTAYRDDILGCVFSGASIPLEFLRREYRIVNHPDHWDIKGFYSYTPIDALIAPRPLQVQMGTKDALHPDKTPYAPKGNWFPGTSRDVTVDEFMGMHLILEKIWGKYSAPISLHFYDGPHGGVDVEGLLEFLDSL